MNGERGHDSERPTAVSTSGSDRPPLSVRSLPSAVRGGAEALFISCASLMTRTREPFRFIHILSHMRSGSTLLAHILFAHPAILGFGETHVRIGAPRDFERLVAKVLFKRRRFLLPGKETYVLDKSLHDDLLDEDAASLLATDNSRVIFLMREPAGTLPSIMKVSGYSEAEARDYYCRRLERLKAYARRITPHRRCFLLTHEDLIQRTEPTLGALGDFLGLEEPLTENYQPLPTTGIAGIGDPSKYIHTGHIVRKKGSAASGYPAELLREARSAFDDAAAHLATLCSTIPDSNARRWEAASPK